MNLLRNSYCKKVISIFLVITILGNVIFPTAAYALTSGPSQPEFVSFTPVGTSDMVNTFTGDLNYNIPLLDVGGYPINIAYTAGGGMDDESTWVGFGWNLNPGAMQRNLRGLPDDFKGDGIVRELNMKSSNTFELNLSRANYEFIGLKGFPEELNTKMSAGISLSYNNYSGYGFKLAGSYGDFSISSSSANGLDFDYEPKITLLSKEKYNKLHAGNAIFHSLTPGLSFNSRTGLNSLTLGYSKSKKSYNYFKFSKSSKSLYNGGYSYSFNSPQFYPQIIHPKFNVSGNLSVNFGMQTTGNFWATTVSGSFHLDYLRKNARKKTINSFGYLYSEHSGTSDDVMLDFSREKDGVYADYVDHLPLTSANFDVFNFTSQGYSGNFRAKRSSVFNVRDIENKNLGGGLGIGGIDFGAASDLKFGVNINLSQNNESSGVWKDNNEAYDEFTKKSGVNEFYEEAYFKMSGEVLPESDIDFFNDLGAFDPIRVELENRFFYSKTAKKIIVKKADNAEETKNIPRVNRVNREKRNENISYLNAENASKFALSSEIENFYGSNIDLNGKCYTKQLISRNNYPSHHLSEFTVTKDDGSKFYYGIPVYNTKQIEATFTVNGQRQHITNCSTKRPCEFSLDVDTRYTQYLESDDSKDNTNGIDHFYEKVTTPPYAYSYLLTAVVSSDYVDLTGNGPSDDDYGTYVKFNYQKLPVNYGWRAPYTGANYSAGMRSVTGTYSDDKASYTYGEKEIWYLHSIETKTKVAEFILADRDDGFGAKMNNRECPHNNLTATGVSGLKKLDKILLFDKNERFSNINAVPLKTVTFSYDYSLCKQVLNNKNNYYSDCRSGVSQNSGKLTLTGIQITNGTSLLGSLSGYTFEYCQKWDHTANSGKGDYVYDESLNPNFDLNSFDRWGNYKAKTGSSSNSINPYCVQDNRADADKYASVWNLTTVNLPSGGKIHIEYEADDYAYVQDKKVMNMMKMVGCANTRPSSFYSSKDAAINSIGNKLYDLNAYLSSGKMTNEYLVFEIPKPVTSNNELYKNYLTDKEGNIIESIYFKFLMKIKEGVNEFVPGYLKKSKHYDLSNPNNYGFITIAGTTSQLAWIRINCIPIVDMKGEFSCDQTIPYVTGVGGTNPISQVAWNYTRSNLPRVAYNQPDQSGSDVMQILESIAGSVVTLLPLSFSFNATMRSRNIADSFDPSKSFIRLFGSTSKVGGGYRVKKIKNTDSWAGEINSKPSEYGVEYSYTNFDESLNKEISSGVASYEPNLGGEENPFRQPIFTEEKRILSSNVEHIQEHPLGESFFPSAVVGYSKVTVKNIHYNTSGLKRNNIGKMEYGFYTSKEYPIRLRSTDIKPIKNNLLNLMAITRIYNTHYTTVSEGYSIETNDMHGKPAFEKVYAYNDENTPISSKSYYYKTEGGFKSNGSNVLNNTAKVIDSKGAIKDAQIGVEFDLVSDFRAMESHQRSLNVEVNADIFTSLLTLIPTLYLGLNIKGSKFRSVVLTKTIQRSALLDSVVVTDLSSSITTHNLLYDQESGQTLLTSVVNQFEDPLYKFGFPAYWAYPTLGPSYSNIGIVISASNAMNNPSAYLNLGDKVELHSTNSTDIGWITRLDPFSIADIEGQSLFIVDYQSLKVIESGNKNLKGPLAAEIVAKKNPILNNELVFDEVINASATEYTDKWRILCNCGILPGSVFNPYARGSKGQWRPYRSFAFLGARTQTRENKNLNTRKDGILTGFTPFWIKKGNQWFANYASNWTNAGEVVNFSPFGYEIENVNPLGVSSSAVYGYGNSLPVIVGNNAKQREIAFDGFEDYFFPGCIDRHFSFENSLMEFAENENVKLERIKHHTGKSSLRIKGQSSISLKKAIEN